MEGGRIWVTNEIIMEKCNSIIYQGNTLYSK